jgi:acyl-CoA thioester hydrolase
VDGPRYRAPLANITQRRVGIAEGMANPALIEVARYRVIFADCDPMRIMYNGTYFRLFEIGWTELFRKLGEPLPGYIARGLFLAVIEARCRYLKPARYDDELNIRAALTGVGPAKVEIGYEIERQDGEVLARATTVHAVVNEENRPQRVPEAFKHAAEIVQPKFLTPP